MAARSPEPAKRCPSPQSLSALAAGRFLAVMSARTSMAAEMRALGVMPLSDRFRPQWQAPCSGDPYRPAAAAPRSDNEQDPHHENEPHDGQDDRTDDEHRSADLHV